jgi:recombinational DNA repair ATPase RecF
VAPSPYASATLALKPGLSVFQGQSAQGKSNLLEHIALFATETL